MLTKEEIISLLKKANITRDMTYDFEAEQALSKAGLSRFNCYDGSSKLCIVFQDADFVVKWSTGHKYDEAVKEAEIYKKAVTAGLEALFPKTAKLCTINEVTFVIQEKIPYTMDYLPQKDAKDIDNIGHTVKDCFVKKMDREFKKASTKYRRDLSPIWAKAVISLYGKRVAKNLCAFVIENRINDLHGANIGFKNGKPMILDFSGYYR